MARIPQRRRINPEVDLHGPIPSLPAPARYVSVETFHYFPQLPYEIRREIWELNLGEPQVIAVGYFVASDGSERYPSRTVVPALLHACTESREVALTYYEPFMPVELWTGAYINWERDYIFPTWPPKEFTSHTGADWSGPRDCRFTSRCKHVLLKQTSLESYIGSMDFRSTQDYAVLVGIENVKPQEDSQSDAKGIALHIEEGCAMQLFDVHQGSEGPYIATIEQDRGSSADIVANKLSFLMTPVIGFVRRPLQTPPEERLRRQLQETQLRTALPPPALQPSYCEDWPRCKLLDEFFSRRLDEEDCEDQAERGYDEATIKRRINDDVKSKMLFEYERLFRHRLLEIRENVRLGRVLAGDQNH